MTHLIPTRGIAVAFLAVVSVDRGPAADDLPAPTVESQPLFDGKSFAGWTGTDGKPVGDGWEVADGAIHLKPVPKGKRTGHIKTAATYENFVLEFDWRVAAGGNSGVKYRTKPAGTTDFGLEYQLLDDAKHKNAKNPLTTAGSLYDLSPADPAKKKLRPIGEFNRGKIVVDHGRVEHWLNGEKLVEAEIGGAEWNAKIAKSKFKNVKGFATGPGVILLQEHLSEAWFKNLRITPLPVNVSADVPAIDFAHEVMPVLTQHCGKCHTGDKKRGGLAMNTRAELLAGGESGPAAVPGDPEKSLFLHLIESSDDGEWMPPEGPRLSAKEIAVLKKWVAAGLPWDAGVVLGKTGWEPPLKPRVVTLPPAQNGRDHPIDRILDADLARRGAPVPAGISDAEFLRRATLDAVGLLPTPAELAAFVADTAPDKRARKIDELLGNDIAYADHWLTVWNDLLRNDYTGTGFITGGRQQITPWLYAALRENKPYDAFVRELIAPTKESAGFIDGIQWRGDVNSSQTRDVQFSQNVSQVFLGINMKCASCHDSFVDRWTLAEAYNLAAVYAEKPLELNRCDKPTGVMATPKWVFPELGDIDPKAPKAERLKQLAGLMTHPDNGRFTRTLVNRLWDRLMGRGVVHPVDAMHTKPWNADLLDHLAVRFAEDEYDLRTFLRFVMTSQAYQSRAAILDAEPGEDYAYAGPLPKRMTAEQFVDAVWQVTGTNPPKPDAAVDRKPKSGPVPPVRAALVISDFFMTSLGRPNRDQVVTTRPSQLTTLQAIDLANGDTLAADLHRGAANLVRRKMSGDDLATWVFRAAVARDPTADERAVLNEIVGDGRDPVAVEDLLWTVFMLPEFQMIR